MFPSFSKQLAYSYSGGSKSQEELPLRRPSLSGPNSNRLPQTFKLVCCALAFTLVGFFLGQSYEQRAASFTSFSLAVRPRMFHYLPTFGEAPSNVSDAAWDELFPERGGFFNHPTIAPERSTYAVFHQLHCLNSLRQAYWTTLEAATSPAALDPETIPFEISPAQMSHCIDLLRQTLMCSPDLTVEVKNETLGGVTGFGTVHKCQDWSQLMDWVEEWQEVGAPEDLPEGKA